MMPGVASYVAWGDTTKGPFGGFTKFRPGFDAGMHTHTADVLVVGLRGAYLYRDDAGAKRVGPGDFIRIPSGHKHWSGGDSKEGALFYPGTFGKFDLIPAKELGLWRPRAGVSNMGSKLAASSSIAEGP